MRTLIFRSCEAVKRLFFLLICSAKVTTDGAAGSLVDEETNSFNGMVGMVQRQVRPRSLSHGKRDITVMIAPRCYQDIELISTTHNFSIFLFPSGSRFGNGSVDANCLT